MTTTSPLSESQLAELSASSLQLCLRVARHIYGFAIEHLLNDAEAAVMASHVEAGGAVRLEIVMLGGLPSARLVLQKLDGTDIELARIQGAALQ